MEQKKELEVAKQMNLAISKVLSTSQINGFEKAYLYATATKELRALLDNQYMSPIMALQGSRLGFKTDKDSSSGYPEKVVKDCLIEAVLSGVQPYGNQFNIIAGNMYITKEGFGYLLSKIEGLSYQIIPELPRIKEGSAAVIMQIKYRINSCVFDEKIDVAIKVNQYMGTDAVIGKATRKARAWLYNTITGSELSDGDAVENDAKKTIDITPKLSIDETNRLSERNSLIDFINKAKDTEALEMLEVEIDRNDDEIVMIFESKRKEIIGVEYEKTN